MFTAISVFGPMIYDTLADLYETPFQFITERYKWAFKRLLNISEAREGVQKMSALWVIGFTIDRLLADSYNSLVENPGPSNSRKSWIYNFVRKLQAFSTTSLVAQSVNAYIRTLQV